MSATWSTVDAVGPWGENSSGVAADGVGNVYVAGDNEGSSYLRQGAAGGTAWANILTYPLDSVGSGQYIEGVAASRAGDVYVAVTGAASGWNILERPAGSTQFVPVYSSSPTQNMPQPNGISVDAAGAVYFTSETQVTVTSKGKTTSQVVAQVWRRPAGGSAFALVDTSPASEWGNAIAATSRGVFEVGRLSTPSGNTSVQHWIVRKSLAGDPGTWSTVDDFQLDAADNLSSQAWGVTADVHGNVLVGGTGTKKVSVGGKPATVQYVLVRRSSNGGATWTTDLVDSGARFAGIATDAAGSAYVAETKGLGGPYGANASVVTMEPSGGTAWGVVDQIGDLAQSAVAYGITADSNNNLYVVGSAPDPVQSSVGFVRSAPGVPAPAAPMTMAFAAVAAPASNSGQAVQVYAPHTHGVAQAAADWWKWALSFSNDNPNPFTDATGALAGLNQSGHVFFMPGVSGPGSTSRTIRVPAGEPVLVPLVVTELSTLEGAGHTPSRVRAADKAFADQIDSLHATIDGVPVPDLFSHREVSPTFQFVAAPNNPIGDPEGDSGVAEADGYWLMLAPMAPGTHVVNAGGGLSALGATFDVTTTIVVAG